jgi:hypothetical protein
MKSKTTPRGPRRNLRHQDRAAGIASSPILDREIELGVEAAEDGPDLLD